MVFSIGTIIILTKLLFQLTGEAQTLSFTEIYQYVGQLLLCIDLSVYDGTTVLAVSTSRIIQFMSG